MNVIAAHKLSLTLGKNQVVDQVDLTIKANEFVGLVGPNGAGKSSLLRMLVGLVKSQTGEVLLTHNQHESSLTSITHQTRAKLIAYLAQHETPAWPLSVKNVVALGRLPWQNASDAESEQAITQAMQMTDVAELSDRPITELSGGELQRVLLARVFAGQPKLIVADEPIAALDVYHQLHVMELLQAHAQEGGAVIAALHDLSLATRFCTRLILMNHGKIIAEGEPYKVLTPENLANVYGVHAHIDCREDGLVIIPVSRVN